MMDESCGRSDEWLGGGAITMSQARRSMVQLPDDNLADVPLAKSPDRGIRVYEFLTPVLWLIAALSVVGLAATFTQQSEGSGACAIVLDVCLVGLAIVSRLSHRP
jgi:hypothetical protein